MIVLRQKEFGWKDVLGRAAQTAADFAKTELDKKYGPASHQGDIIFGTLFIDWCVEKSRYIGKDKEYKVHDNYEVEAFDKGSSSFGWELDEPFEPTDACPKSWKSFMISGIAKDGELLDAIILTKDGKRLQGKVVVEVSRM